MSGKTAALIGATGMVGNYLLQELINDPAFETIRVIVRRPFTKTSDKIVIRLVDFADYESLKMAIDGSDVLFVAIGTTQKKVKGNKDQYRKIDFDIPVKAAKICKETGCDTFVLVSSTGADRNSKNFYLRLKGEIEDAITVFDLRSVHFMQPSILMGERKEKRFGENAGIFFMRTFSFLFTKRRRKYRPIHGKEVARAMLRVGKSAEDGIFMYTHDELKRLSV